MVEGKKELALWVFNIHQIIITGGLTYIDQELDQNFVLWTAALLIGASLSEPERAPH